MTEQREPVLEVIRALQRDWQNGQPDGWKNWTIPQYLDAMGAWLEVYEGLTPIQGVPFDRRLGRLRGSAPGRGVLRCSTDMPFLSASQDPCHACPRRPIHA